MTLPDPTRLLPEPTTERLQTLHMMLHFMDREGERYWHRNGVFVTIATGLFALYLAKFEDFVGAFSIAYGLFGFGVGLGWLQTLRTGKYYAERWRLDAREYVKQFPDLENVFRTASGNARIRHPKGGKSSEVMKVFALVTVVVSIGVLLLGIWQLHSGQTSSTKAPPNICISSQNPKSPKFVECPNLKTETPDSEKNRAGG